MPHPDAHVLRDITLLPSQVIQIGMLLRMRYCADRRFYVDVSTFLLKERFTIFTRTVAMPFIGGSAVVMHGPGSGRPQWHLLHQQLTVLGRRGMPVHTRDQDHRTHRPMASPEGSLCASSLRINCDAAYSTFQRSPYAIYCRSPVGCGFVGRTCR